jgi:hypothetical protein
VETGSVPAPGLKVIGTLFSGRLIGKLQRESSMKKLLPVLILAAFLGVTATAAYAGNNNDQGQNNNSQGQNNNSQGQNQR